MLKFFRRLRQKLIIEGNLKSYILYAIGEIFLIVIGILIALQLNEWKENKSNKRTEIKILSEILSNLTDAESSFISNIEIDKKIIDSKQVLIDVIDNDIPWNDSLQLHFNLFNFWNSYSINSTAYNSLENWGINNISSDSIRRQIADIFQIELIYLREMGIDEREVRLGAYNDLISTKLDWSNIEMIKPVNYKDFLKTEELSSRMKALKTFTTLTLNNRIEILEKIKIVRKNLFSEIDRLKKL